MNDVSYESPRPDAVRDLSQALAAQQAAGAPTTEEAARDFLARVQRDIDEQVDLRMQQQLAAWTAANPGTGLSPRDRAQHARDVMLGSLGIGVPLTIGAGIFGGIWGIVIVWVGLIIINVAWARLTSMSHVTACGTWQRAPQPTPAHVRAYSYMLLPPTAYFHV